MRPHLTWEQRQLVRRLSANGLSLREIGRQVGCSHDLCVHLGFCLPPSAQKRLCQTLHPTWMSSPMLAS
jgi:Helix-turn-helix domain